MTVTLIWNEKFTVNEILQIIAFHLLWCIAACVSSFLLTSAHNQITQIDIITVMGFYCLTQDVII